MVKQSLYCQEIWKTVATQETNYPQMSYIVEDATKSISKLRKLEHQTRNRFQTYLCLENSFFVQKLQEIFFGMPLLSKKLEIKYPRDKLIP